MIDQIVALTQARRAGDGFLGKCPAHDDSKASLSFKDAGGKILLRCFTGCSFDAIREALKSRGIDLGSSKDPGWETVWKVYGLSREVVAEHVRIDYSTGPKKIFWRAPGGGKMAETGVKLSDLPPYAWERVPQDESRVFVCEGEKDADSLLRRGIQAVGTFGAEVFPKAEALAFLKGHDVVLWPDNDEPGRKHMTTIGVTLKGLGIAHRTVTWPEAPAKGGAADWKGDGLEALERLVSPEPVFKFALFKDRLAPALKELALVHNSDTSRYVSTGISKLDEHLGGGMPRRKVTLIGAPTGAGKTTLVMQFAMAAQQEGLVIVVSPEMSAEELIIREITRRAQKPKWEASKWAPEAMREQAIAGHYRAFSELEKNPPNVAIYDALDVSMGEVHDGIRHLAKREKISLIALDYAQQLADDNGKTPRYLAVGEVALRAIEMAREFDAAVLVTSQVNPIRGEKGKVVAYGIRESANLEQKASNVLLFLVQRDEKGRVTEAHFQCTKARDGSLFRLEVDFNSSCLSVTDKQAEPQKEITEIVDWRNR